MANPLVEDTQTPPFGSIDASHIEPAIDSLIDAAQSTLAQVIAAGDVSYEGLLMPLEEAEDRLQKAAAPARHLNSVLNSPALRAAWDASHARLSDYFTARHQHEGFFKACKALVASPEYADLPPARQKVVDNAIRDFKLAGIDLPADQRHRFAEIARRLSELSNQFSNNVLDATMGWTRLVQDKAELTGLPESTLALLEQTAKQRGKQGYLLTLDHACYMSVMSYCENAAIREQMYEAFVTRASDTGPNAGAWDNSAVMQEILQLRQQQARLLGYRNYAESALATRMAGTTGEVMDFLTQLAERAHPKAVAEFEEVCDFARKEYGVTELKPWDVAFYSEKLKQATFDVDDEALRPYFPLPRVLQGLFELAHRLYDIEIRPATDMETWHDDVTTWGIYRSEALIARFYLDPYARPNKQGGAWMDECRTRRRTAAGNLQLPVAFLTCNFNPPVGEDPALLTHTQVITLFHEFGHGLHQMMTQVDCAPVSGINGVAWDAVELPSQFMENWCWEPEALAFISGHYQTGEPLPRETLDKLLAARQFQSGMKLVRQLEFGLFDFRLHMEFDEREPGQLMRILGEVQAQVGVMAVPDYYRFGHAFSHIFGGGYAAGYYSYLWAEVLSSDAFSRFEQEGLFNRQLGERFLESVLERGGSVEAMDLFRDFMGREPELDALLRHRGVS